MKSRSSRTLSSTLALTAATLMTCAIAQNVPMGPIKAGPNAAVTGSPNTAGNSGAPPQSTGAPVVQTTTASGAMGKSSSNAGSLRTGASLSRADRSFLMKAAEAGVAEIQTGKLAQSNGANPDVKKFGERMVQDHSKAGAELKQIALSRGVTLPEAADRSHRRMAKQLQNLSGDKFDRVYAREAGVKDHKAAVALFTREAQKTTDAELKGFAQKTLPTLQEHLKMAEAMHDSVILKK